MRHIAAIVLCVAGGSAAADPEAEWQGFADDAAIESFLIAHPLTYETGATQSFLDTGRTLYRYGETSWGYWRIEDGRFCSQWPPSDDWACYDMAHDGGTMVRFTDDWGNTSVGQWTVE